MDEQKILAERFEADRPHLRRVAFRMLGSLSEAEDAVQETWLRLARSDASEVGNLTGWLTTVVARIALDMLRARKARREDAVEPAEQAAPGDPAKERELADTVGVALLIVLEALEPAERIAFVLHDMFDLPFGEIAPILGRSSDAARQLASRARRRVRGAPSEQAMADRRVVDAFLAAARSGDMEGLLAVLDPGVVVRGDAAAMRLGGARAMTGSQDVARAFAGRAQAARSVWMNGKVGFLVTPGGKLLLAVDVTVRNGRITLIEGIADPGTLARMEFALPD